MPSTPCRAACRWWVMVLGLISLLGCTLATPSLSERSLAPPLPEYTGPKALITVLDFEDETSSAGTFDPALGRGMRTMLKEALVKSQRFLVFDLDLPTMERLPHGPPRPTAISPSNRRGKPRVPRPQAGSEAPQSVLGPDIAVKGAITSWEVDAKGTTMTGGSLTLPRVPVRLPNVSIATRHARVTVALSWVDMRSQQIVAIDSLGDEATSRDVVLSGELGIRGVQLPLELGQYAKDPVGEVLRRVIAQAVAATVRQLPPRYYRYAEAPPAATLTPRQ